jgi:hypothetical protein
MPRKIQELGLEGPGVAPQKRIKAIEDAAEDYVSARDARMIQLEAEIQKRDSLLALMQKNGLSTYTYDDEKIEVIPGPIKVKVRKVSEPEYEQEPDEED